MKMRSHDKIALFAGALLLIGSLAVAQTPVASGKNAPHQASAGPSTPDSAKSMGSAHATESLAAQAPTGSDGNKKDSKQSYPMYKENKNTGENPLFEEKSSLAHKPSSSGTATVQYKDPEDMTTRYRPGNNKTSKINAKSASRTTSSH